MATVIAAIVLAVIAVYFASIATITAGFVCVVVFLAISNYFLATLYGHEATLSRASLLKFLSRWLPSGD